jgi:hypothetical protein
LKLDKKNCIYKKKIVSLQRNFVYFAQNKGILMV